MPQRELIFDGPALTQKDNKRLTTQLGCVRDIMGDGEWRTLEQIQREMELRDVAATTQGISARLRDLRKPRFGNRTVDRRRLDDGLFAYRLAK